MTKKALIVGIDDYHFNKLYGCVNDATAFNKLIARNGDNTLNFDTRFEINVGSRANMRGLIKDLFSADSDIALLYYSGHGFVNEYGGYIVTLDTRKNDEGVSMDDILDIANSSKAKNKIIILDCCHSGAIGEPDPARYRNAAISAGTTILTASKQQQAAVEVNGHGVFTNLLLEALKGGAADIRGNITPGSIYAYIDRALGSWDQRPVFKTNVSNFISLRNVTPQISLDVLHKLTDYFAQPLDEFALNPSYEYTNLHDFPHIVKAPFAVADNVTAFKNLKKMQTAGLVTPLGEEHMYYAAMNSTACGLTPLGRHYWRLVKNGKI